MELIDLIRNEKDVIDICSPDKVNIYPTSEQYNEPYTFAMRNSDHLSFLFFYEEDC